MKCQGETIRLHAPLSFRLADPRIIHRDDRGSVRLPALASITARHPERSERPAVLLGARIQPAAHITKRSDQRERIWPLAPPAQVPGTASLYSARSASTGFTEAARCAGR